MPRHKIGWLDKLPVTFLRASTDFDTLSRASEIALRKLSFDFICNGHESLTEFEVSLPAYFRVVIEPNKIPRTRALFIPSIEPPLGSTIDIRFDIDSDEEGYLLALQHARMFIHTLLSSLDRKPWEGLKGSEAGREEKRWKELLDEMSA